MKVSEIDRAAVDRWLAAHANYAPASVNLWIRCLNRTLKLAGCSFRAEQIRAPRPRPNALSEEQLQQLLDHAGRLRPLLLMAAYTGARRSEVCLLEWRDVDLDRSEVYFTDSKNGTQRTVPLHPELVRVLRPLRDRGGRYVFRAEATRLSSKITRRWRPSNWAGADAYCSYDAAVKLPSVHACGRLGPERWRPWSGVGLVEGLGQGRRGAFCTASRRSCSSPGRGCPSLD
jgi:integrase